MKCIPVLLLSAAALFADDFTTGQAARAVIGQETFTAQSDQPSATVLGGISGLAYDSATDTLFVADSNRVSAAPINHRVLLFKNISSSLPPPAAELPYTIKCPVCVGQASVVLGQPDFVTTSDPTPVISPSNLRTPTAVASDGVHLVVADTDHNRVLIWNSIPTTNDQPADVVVGQPNFTTGTIPGNTPTAQSMRGPQGVWIQNGKLYVADTQNHRILIFNHIPTANGTAADLALGQPNLTTFVQPDLTQQQTGALPTNLLNPVAVTSDGTRLFVTDLGNNRVLIWNSIPTTNDQPADLVVGQPDLMRSIPNNGFATNTVNGVLSESPVLCTTSSGTDTNGNPTYPAECNSTLNFPRFALSDGHRLFIADGGNDRLLVFEQIPTQNGQAADIVIGQLGGEVNQASDAADSLRTPMSLAWDGTNLYVSDAFNRRITVYSIGANTIPYSGVRNAASLAIFSIGSVAISLNSGSSITAGDLVSVTIGNSATNAATCTTPPTPTATGATSTDCGEIYTYDVQTNDTLDNIVNGLAAQINAGSGDPNVTATADVTDEAIVLTAKQEGTDGNNVTVSTIVSTNSTITATASGATLAGGADAAKIGPGTIVSILGSNLSFNTVSADLTQPSLPSKLGGTEVYFNGIASPLLFVSSTQINAQVPWELQDQTSINAYVRSTDSSGNVVVTTPVAVTIVTQNPGIFAQPTPSGSLNLKPGVVLHASSQANGVVLVDGSVTPNDVATITIEDRQYNYTIQSGDTLDTIRLALAALVNLDPKVTATSSATFARNVIIQARIAGPDGDNIAFSATSSHPGSTSSLILTATNTTLCCANVAGSPVTNDNPAVPGETLLIYTTGLGLPVVDASIQPLIATGVAYPANGPVTVPRNFVSAQAGGKTANVLRAGLQPGTVGIFEVLLQLNSSMPANSQTQLFIAQDVFLSNIVTFPLVTPVPFVPPTQ